MSKNVKPHQSALVITLVQGPVCVLFVLCLHILVQVAHPQGLRHTILRLRGLHPHHCSSFLRRAPRLGPRIPDPPPCPSDELPPQTRRDHPPFRSTLSNSTCFFSGFPLLCYPSQFSLTQLFFVIAGVFKLFHSSISQPFRVDLFPPPCRKGGRSNGAQLGYQPNRPFGILQTVHSAMVRNAEC